MKFNDYILNEKEDNTSMYVKLQEFFIKNPNPKDSEIHAFAEREGINTHRFEEIVYELIGSFLGEGRSKDFDGDYDPEEMKMGIEIEMEHTTNKFISEKIAKDHLAEFSDYYTALKKMEDNLKEK